MKLIGLILLLAAMLGGCAQSIEIVEGASHAKGTIQVQIDGVYSNTQGEIKLCKVPDNYTAEEAKEFCDE